MVLECFQVVASHCWLLAHFTPGGDRKKNGDLSKQALVVVCSDPQMPMTHPPVPTPPPVRPDPRGTVCRPRVPVSAWKHGPIDTTSFRFVLRFLIRSFNTIDEVDPFQTQCTNAATLFLCYFYMHAHPHTHIL